jgi:hypothetical protein
MIIIIMIVAVVVMMTQLVLLVLLHLLDGSFCNLNGLTDDLERRHRGRIACVFSR